MQQTDWEIRLLWGKRRSRSGWLNFFNTGRSSKSWLPLGEWGLGGQAVFLGCWSPAPLLCLSSKSLLRCQSVMKLAPTTPRRGMEDHGVHGPNTRLLPRILAVVLYHYGPHVPILHTRSHPWVCLTLYTAPPSGPKFSTVCPSELKTKGIYFLLESHIAIENPEATKPKRTVSV